MPKEHGLSPQQLAFCRHLLSGTKSQAEAYRLAGYNSQRPDIDGCKLANSPKISQYLRQRQESMEKKDIFTKEKGLKILLAVAEDDQQQGSARVSAVATAAKMLGWNEPDKLTVGVEDKLASLLAKARGE